jgi:CRISPR-associated protein Cas1
VSVLGDGSAYDPALREKQIAASTNGLGSRIATRLIQGKLIGSQVTLRTLRKTLARELALSKLEAVIDELQTVPSASIEELRLLEARGALVYFTCWQSLQLRWKGTGRRPIPPEWERVGLRQSLLNSRNRHANHPVNAMLNYAYAVLESEVRVATIAQGLDPMIGYLHACRPGRVALVYDLMEPLRPQVDRLVLGFVRSHTFSPSDFVMGTDGVCRLHPQLARKTARLAVSDLQVRDTITLVAEKFETVNQPRKTPVPTVINTP